MASLTEADLLESYRSYEKPRERWLVGAEFERAVLRQDGQPVPYFGEDGIAWLLQTFMDRHAWKPKYEGEHLIELKGPPLAPTPADPYLTLEPGAQVELSGAAYAQLSDLAKEAEQNQADLQAILNEKNLVLSACGLTPYATIADIPFVPKGRYAVMQRYLPAQGARAHWMMKGTCAVQASFDFSDEKDAARKFHLITDLAPLTVAMFANSPIAEGRPSGWQSTRAWIWTQTDATRTGFPPGVMQGYTHQGWVDYLLDSPMMFYMRGKEWMPAHGRSFRSWLKDGIEGQFPTMADWQLHQTSVFPEARIKNTVEIRSADAVSLPLGVAFCAYWKGLLYNDAALDAARAVANRMIQGSESHADRHLQAAKLALGARFGGHAAAELAQELVQIATQGLKEMGEVTALIEPLTAQMATGRAPAQMLLEAWEQNSDPKHILPLITW